MESKPIDLGLLRSFSPLDGMKRENLHSLARKAQVRELAVGRLLFKEGDNDKRTYYLLKGCTKIRNTISTPPANLLLAARLATVV